LHAQADFSRSIDRVRTTAHGARRMLFSPRRPSPLLALAGAVAPIWILSGAVVFGALRSGYDASHAISELGEQGSSNAVAWNITGFGGTALLSAVYSVAIAAVFGRGWLFRLTVLQALGAAGSGLFSCDPGCPPVMVTWQGWVHTVSGLTYFAATCVLPVLAWHTFRRRADFRPLAQVSLMAGVLLIALFFAGPFIFGPDRVGIWQRVTIVLSGAWAAAVALRLWTLLGRDSRGALTPASPAGAHEY
jgi:hypothetical protein